jgi:TnpA family transposase
VENWNSANDCIFFGTGGEMATNRFEDQEWARLSLHLVQMSLVYILRFLNDPTLRQQVRTQLHRGEARQGVAQRIFFADQGMFRSGDYCQIMNRVSCLSLLSNAVLVYNTLRMTHVRARVKAQGQEFTPEDIAPISPLAYRHVVVNGTYDFSPPHHSPLQD